MATINRMLSQCALYLIRGYRFFLSPLIGYDCRFHPSCSCYAQDAIQLYGLWKGGYLFTRRILRCHPWQAGGIDLVPLKK